jgi:hypothetical protein
MESEVHGLCVRLSVDRTGYYPGQTVRATVSVLARQAVQLDQARNAAACAQLLALTRRSCWCTAPATSG